MREKIWMTGYFVVLVLYAIFSYSLTAPNLIFTSWSPYWQFQTWMWAHFFNNRPLLTHTYLVLITGLIVCYIWLLKSLSRSSRPLSWRQLLLLMSPALLTNNALSYDVFNYIFNAKMVVLYQANPHVKVALDYAYDDWVRFMHNTHTPAPYGYGWTGLSLLPYLLGGGKFLLTWFWFRVMSLISWLGLYAVMAGALSHLKLTDEHRWWLAVVLLNPLVVVEIISNSHNDLWMMVPALLALLLVQPAMLKQSPVAKTATSVLLLLLSISIKFATILLIPLWVISVGLTLVGLFGWRFSPATLLIKIHTHWQTWWPFLASVLLFLPLASERSQQFHPWYLTWSLVWIPLLQPRKQWTHRWWITWLLVFSFTSLYRYLPYLWVGEYSPLLLVQQRTITWSAIALGLIANVINDSVIQPFFTKKL